MEQGDMNEILEMNRAYQFARLESALQSGRRDQAQSALARLRQLGVEVGLSRELQFLAGQIEQKEAPAENRQEAAS